MYTPIDPYWLYKYNIIYIYTYVYIQLSNHILHKSLDKVLGLFPLLMGQIASR